MKKLTRLKSNKRKIISLGRKINNETNLPEGYSHYLVPYSKAELIHGKGTHHFQIIHKSKIEEIKAGE